MRVVILSGLAAIGLLAAASVLCGQEQVATLKPPLPADDLRASDLLGETRLGLPEKVPGVEQTDAAIARLRLGRKLFFDPILSSDHSVSCASCHEPDHGFASREARPLGVAGHRAARNAPPAFNRAFGTSQFWDGRAATLEAQVIEPIQNPDEMGLPLDEAAKRLGADAGYRELFAAAGYPAPDRAAIASSLAEFLRRLVVADSPIDRFRAARGELTPLERRGLWIFESKGRCWRCHAGPNFSDEAFHNTGVGVVDEKCEPGREAVTKDAADAGRFKTPTLRMVAHTAPYMHDGSLATLEDVLKYYKRGGNKNDHLDPLLEPIDLTDDDIAAVVAFLQALSRPAEAPATAAAPDDAAGMGDAPPPNPAKPKKRRAY
jgi:cytochrome c peroxidase